MDSNQLLQFNQMDVVVRLCEQLQTDKETSDSNASADTGVQNDNKEDLLPAILHVQKRNVSSLVQVLNSLKLENERLDKEISRAQKSEKFHKKQIENLMEKVKTLRATHMTKQSFTQDLKTREAFMREYCQEVIEKLEDLCNTYYPQEDEDSPYISMLDTIMKLKPAHHVSPDDMYVRLDERMNPSYIQTLIFYGIIEYHPDNRQIVRVVSNIE